MSLTTLASSATTKFLAKQVFGTTVGSIFSYIKWILILSIVSFVLVKGYSFYDNYQTMTKTITEQATSIKNLNVKVSELDKRNADLEKQLDLKDKSGKIDTGSVTDLAKTNENSAKTFDDIKTNLKDKVTEVRKNPVKRVVDKQSNKTTEVRMTDGEITDAVSKIRIDAIWKSFCSSNKIDQTSAQSCKELTV